MPDPMLAVAVIGIVITLWMLNDAIAGPRPTGQPQPRPRRTRTPRARRVPPPPADLERQEPPELARYAETTVVRCADCGFELDGSPCGCQEAGPR